MKRNTALIALTLLIILPIIMPLEAVSAQNANYTINRIDHQIEVMYSGQIVIRDTIHISGQIQDGFMIGLPFKYGGADILKGIAYDSENVYQLNMGLQLGDRSGFYAVSVDFEGKNPQVFTVAFILSNRFIAEQDFGVTTLDFPAYPSLTTDVSTVNVNLIFPSNPTSITITKDDGEIASTNYGKTNLPAYTYSPAKASLQLPAETLQLARISELNRRIQITPAGIVTSQDSYRITNNATTALRNFQMGLPADASNVIVRDEFGRMLTSTIGAVKGKTLQVNITLISPLSITQSITLTADYNLPSTIQETSNFALKDFILYPDFNYYVEKGTFTFTPPEGAVISIPQLNSLESSTSLKRDTFQDTLSITKQGISYLDFSTPSPNTLQLAYNYNPVWSSFKPTFWATFLAVIGCVAVVFLRKRQPPLPSETIHEHILTRQTPATSSQPATEPKVFVRINPETLRNFTEAYEERKEAVAELKSLDARAQRGKIPRRQYKLQHRALETRVESLSTEIKRIKATLRSSTGIYSDLARQLDLAEKDLSEAEGNIRALETQQSRGEITLDVYKRNLGDYQRRKDKAESTISGILLRLREKIH